MRDVWLILTVFATYRITRFLIADSLIDGTRNRVKVWLAERSDHLAASKLFDLIDCPYCVSVWIAGALTAINVDRIDGIRDALLVWLGVAGATMLVWRNVES